MIIRTKPDGTKYPIENAYESTNDLMNDLLRSEVQKQYELYHGSNKDFNEFDDKYIGSNSLGGLSYGKGHYFLDVEKDKYGGISIYGKYGYKVNVKLKKPFIVQEQLWATKLENMGYDFNNRLNYDPNDFLSSKGYDATILKNGNKISEAIIFSNNDKKINIVEKISNY